METLQQHLEKTIPIGNRCENCLKADTYITGQEGPLLKGYIGPYFCHLHEELIEDGYKICGVNDPDSDLLIVHINR